MASLTEILALHIQKAGQCGSFAVVCFTALVSQFASKPEDGLLKTILYLEWKLGHCTFRPKHPLEKPESHLSPPSASGSPRCLCPFQTWRLGEEVQFPRIGAFEGRGHLQVHLPFLSSSPGTGGRSQVPPRPVRELSWSLEVSLKGRQPV